MASLLRRIDEGVEIAPGAAQCIGLQIVRFREQITESTFVDFPAHLTPSPPGSTPCTWGAARIRPRLLFAEADQIGFRSGPELSPGRATRVPAGQVTATMRAALNRPSSIVNRPMVPRGWRR